MQHIFSLESGIANIFTQYASVRDFFDILIVAVLAYAILVLLKKTKSTPILFGVLLLVAVYGISIGFNLRVTERVFSSLFGAVVIICAILFQKELRRFLALIGVFGIQKRALPPSEQALRILINTIQNLARSHIGAIFVLAGSENIDRFLEGGHTLNGKLSEALLLSIFNTATPGHDGAVIIDGDKVRKFAVHLPLAESIETAKKYGTRHRAAIGLSEATDALCIVVSEERGSISIAHDKKMTVMETEKEFEDTVRAFLKKRRSFSQFSQLTAFTKEQMPLMVAALALAVVAWGVVSLQGALFIQKKYVIPIEFKNLPENLTITEFAPEEAIITYSGRESIFSSVNEDALRVFIDVKNIKRKAGWRNLLIEKNEVPEIPGATIIKIEPEMMKAHLAEVSQ
jgi:uncharacterized protein (TIGR00159 family)